MTQLERQRTLHDHFEPWVLSEALTRHDLAVAVALADMCGEDDQHLILALAFAVAAPQSGHTAIDLREIREHTLVNAESRSPTRVTDVENLSWPENAAKWLEDVSKSRLVTSTQSPLVVDRDLIYLRRFFHHEERVAERLTELARASRPTVSNADVSNVLHLSRNQQHAVEVCGRARLGVLTGPPGSGKTRTVVALVADEFVTSPTARVALAAPTGKAAARMAESVAESIDLLSAADDEPIVAAASALQLVVPSTVHRLLGARGSDSFRYDLHNPLPFDLIVVDEASMLSLPLVDALLQALHPTARLVFVGDAGQLASVDAGSVLGDIAGADGPIHTCVAELTETHRFPADSVIGQFSSAVLQGDSDAAVHVLDEALGTSALSTSEIDGIVLEMLEEP
ncbi:MAG: AAA family ATPase, partial [Actinomycetota bacterium]|nr:AAA family ATPase [Actinomycetota bacterium]